MFKLAVQKFAVKDREKKERERGRERDTQSERERESLRERKRVHVRARESQSATAFVRESGREMYFRIKLGSAVKIICSVLPHVAVCCTVLRCIAV